MESFFGSMVASAHGMVAQASRLRVTSENIANADTPGYRRKISTFEQVAADGGEGSFVAPGQVVFGKEELTRVYDPGHPLADQTGYFDGSNVEMMVEVGDAREAQRSYEANLKMFEQARQMAVSFLELLRR